MNEQLINILINILVNASHNAPGQNLIPCFDEIGQNILFLKKRIGDKYEFLNSDGEEIATISGGKYYFIEDLIKQKNQLKSANNANFINQKSIENQPENNIPLSINQPLTNEQLNKLHSKFNYLMTQIKSRPSAQTGANKAKLDYFQNQFTTGQMTNNIQLMTQSIEKLQSYRNKQQGALKAQEYKGPGEEFSIDDHKKALSMIRSNFFLRKATNGRYKNYMELPENCPIDLINFLKKRNIKNGNKLYTVSIMTKVINAAKDRHYANRRQQLIIRLSIILITVIMGIGLYWKFNKEESIEDKPTIINKEANHSSQPTPRKKDKIDIMIDQYQKATNTKIWQWRREKIRALIKKEKITDDLAIKAIIAEGAIRKDL